MLTSSNKDSPEPMERRLERHPASSMRTAMHRLWVRLRGPFRVTTFPDGRRKANQRHATVAVPIAY